MEAHNAAIELTVRDYVRVVFRQKGVIFATFVTVMVMAVLGALLKTPVYESQVKMLISGRKQAQAEYYTDISISSYRSAQITLTQTEIVTSDPVIERTVSVLGLAKKPFDYEKRFCSVLKKPLVNLRRMRVEKKLDSLPEDQRNALLFRMAMEDLRRRLNVEPVRDTDLFLIEVRDFNPLAAAITANVLSRSFAIFDLEQQFAEMKLKYGEKNQSVIQLKEAIDKMSQGLNGAPLSPMDAIGPASVKVIEQGKVPLKPSGISRKLIVLLAFFMGLFLSLMMGFAFEYADQKFRSPSEAETTLGMDYVGSLRRKPKKDDYYSLSEELYLVLREKGAKSVLFASATAYEGAVQIISHFGEFIAGNLHKRILLIDANLRKPVLPQLLKLAETRDLLNVLEGKTPLEKGVKNLSKNLDVLATGSMVLSPVELLESNMKNLIDLAVSQYDLVLVNSTPLKEAKDAAIISGMVDGVVVVVNERRTRRQVIKNALEPLKARGASFIGVVLSNRCYPVPGIIYDRL
ncbi:MAG: hypothetical protein JW937_02960 [Candidatus Omnitrophica bacterium]|nr:hypothetical protein [Candidatus Omnitrophota bacterium]